MPIKHSLLTGADLHEPKGVANANPNTVYVANGAGSGAWGKMRSLIQGPTIVGNDSAVKYVGFPVAVRIYSVILTMADAVTSSDTTLTFLMKNSSGSVIGTFVFTVASSGPGTSVSVPMYVSVDTGSYVTFEVSGTQSTNQCRVEPTLAVELV